MTQKIEARRFSQAYFTDRPDNMWKKVYVNRDVWRCTRSSRVIFFTSKRDRLVTLLDRLLSCTV